MRDAGGADAVRARHFAEEVRGRLPFDSGIGRQDYLADFTGLQPCLPQIQAKFIGTP